MRNVITLIWMMMLASTLHANIIQNHIEKELKQVLDSLLDRNEFYVYAIVENNPYGDQKPMNLPYSATNLNTKVIDAILFSAYPDLDTTPIKVTVKMGLDSGINPEKRQVITKIIRERFGIDGNNRKLVVEVAALVKPDKGNNEAEILRLERARMMSERERMLAEVERVRLDAARRELEAEKKSKPTAIINTGQDNANLSSEPEESITLLKDLQLSAAAVILGGAGILSILALGYFMIRSAKPVANALASIGGSLATMQSDDDSSKSSALGGDLLSGGTPDLPAQEKMEVLDPEILEMVVEKFNVLISEGNYNFIQTFSDLALNRETVVYAAGVLISLNDDILKTLSGNMPIEAIQAIVSFLSDEKGFEKARAYRHMALNRLYSLIAVDEFYGSPVFEVSSCNWILQMSTTDLITFAQGLPKEERAIFLAILSPQRVSLMIKKLNSETERKDFLASVAGISQVSREQILAFIEKVNLDKSYEQRSRSRESDFGIGSSVRYFLSMADNLERAEREILLAELSKTSNFATELRKVYFPISDVLYVGQDDLSELVTDLSNKDLSLMLFDVDVKVKTKIVNVLPEFRREVIRAEIETLYQEKNQVLLRKQSQELQKRLTNALLKLVQQDLLVLNQGNWNETAEMEQQESQVGSLDQDIKDDVA